MYTYMHAYCECTYIQMVKYYFCLESFQRQKLEFGVIMTIKDGDPFFLSCICIPILFLGLVIWHHTDTQWHWLAMVLLLAALKQMATNSTSFYQCASARQGQVPVKVSLSLEQWAVNPERQFPASWNLGQSCILQLSMSQTLCL